MPNYIYKFLLDKNGQIVYPRTPLSAIDVTTTNGIQISGDTMSVVFATKEQIASGEAGHIISADGLREAIAAYGNVFYTAGGGIDIQGGTVYAKPAPILSILDGTKDRGDSVTNANLSGALNLGRTVDVTTMPPTKNYYTPTNFWTVSTYEEYTGPEGNQVKDDCYQLQHTAPSIKNYMFWGWNVLPKFAPGFRYLIIADVKCVSGFVRCSINVDSANKDFEICDKDGNPITPRGSTDTMPLLTSEWKRYAKGFTYDHPDIGIWFYNTTTDALDVRVKHFMVFEVTALSDEAIYALATMDHPEDIYAKYLVKKDAVCPWINIINMQYSAAVTIGAGLSYKLIANDGNDHTLMVDTFPENAYGRDAFITLFVGDAEHILVQSPLVLMDPLTPNAVNNCTIKFRDGYARIYVTDTDYGYTVTVTSGSTDGSLKYGLVSTTEEYIVIASTLDGEQISFNGAVVPANRKANILGHGTDKTTLTGDVAPAATMEMHQLSLSDVNVTGGTMVIPSGVEMNNGTTTVSNGLVVISGGVIGSNGDVVVSGGTLFCKDAYMNDGAVISVSGGDLAMEKVTGVGEGSVIDLGKTAIPAATSIQVSGVTLTNGLTTAQSTNNASGGVFRLNNGSVGVSNATFVANSSTVLGACAYIRNGATMTVSNAVLNNNDCGVNGGCFYTNGVLNIFSCTFSGNTAQRGGMLYVGDGGHATITDSEITSCNATILGGAVALYGNNTDLTLINCYVHDNGETNGAFYVKTNGVGSAHLIISGSTIQDSIYMLEPPTLATFSGTNVFGSTVYGSGTAIITSGAILDLTGNTNTVPIAPGHKTIIEDATFLYGPTAGTVTSSATITGATFGSVPHIGNDANLVVPTSQTIYMQGNATYNGLKFQAASWRPIWYTVKFIDCSFEGQIYTAISKDDIADITVAGTCTFSNTQYVFNCAVSYAGIVTLENNTILTVTPATVNNNYFMASMKTLTIGTGVTVNTKSLPAGIFTSARVLRTCDMILDGTGTISTAAKLDATITGTTGSLVFSAGAVLNLTGNSNPYPVAPGGTMTFASGGATVKYTSGTGSKSYLMNNVVLSSGAKLTNTAVVDLNQTNVVVGGTAYASGCTFTNGKGFTGGALSISSSTARATLVDCIISGNTGSNRAGGIDVFSGTVDITGCTFAANTAGNGGNGLYVVECRSASVVSNCVFSSGQDIVVRSAGIILSGSNTINKIQYLTNVGSVTIANGAILDLTNNTSATPIAPGGGIAFEEGGATVLYGSTESPSSCTINGASITTMIGNDGSFVSDSSHLYLFGGATVSNLTFKGTSTINVRGNYTLVNCTGSQTLAIAVDCSAKISGTYQAVVRTGFMSPGTLEFADGAVVTMTNASADTVIALNVGTVIVGNNCTINGNTIMPGTYTSATIKKDGTITEA